MSGLRLASAIGVVALSLASGGAAWAAAARNGPLRTPLVASANWWSADISTAPLDPGSAAFISFLGGAGRGLHPDFGGEVTACDVYGFPFVTVDATQPRRAVQFAYADESDGVDHVTGLGIPFYPIPDEAITQCKWIEGGPPGDQSVGGDRHMLIYDTDNQYLYELYALSWNGSAWTAGSGAFFDLKTNGRRPEGWTSADAAGLAILPGLVRYDETFGAGEIGHAFRVTVRATNGYTYPASHRAGSTAGALPMGARLRLKTSRDISGFTPEVQRIFRAMKRYGLIVADNGSDMYVSGVHDTRWDNGVLNPAFSALRASDFEVVKLGWSPSAPPPTPTMGTPAVTFPTDGSTLTASTQTLAWTAVAKADPSLTLSYEVLLTDVAGGNKTELQITVPDPGTSTIYSLHGSSLYELMVRACQTVCGAWSAPVTFAVTLPAVPAAAPAVTGCTVSGGNSLTCNWNAVVNADLYDFYVVQPPPAGPGGGALTVAARVVSATAATLPVPAGIADVIVSACNGDGCGPFSSPVRINPAGPNPAAASLGTPLGGSVVSGPTVTFSWNRVPGDNGSNTIYRLFVQDLSRQATALDVYTTQNFWAAYFKAEGARYDALVVARPGPSQVVGPAQGFNVSGTSASAPTMVSPGHQSSVVAGNVLLGWSPVLGAGLYQFYLAAQVGGGVVTGVTSGLAVQVPLGTVGGAATPYSGIARACPSGMTCTVGSDVNWGPWSNAPGGPGVTNFVVTP